MAEREKQNGKAKDEQEQPAGRFAYDGLERVIHERARLSILSSLAANTDGLSFNDLKQLCQLTDGNLSRQLQLLLEQGFVDVVKSTKNNRPHTQVLLNESGRERFLEYIAVLEGVVADAMQAAERQKDSLPLPGVRRALG